MESRNDEKKIWMPTMISVAASTGQVLVGELSEAVVDPLDDDEDADRAAGHDEHAAERQAVLERVAGPHPVKPPVSLGHEVRRVGVGADPERHHLRPDDRQQGAADEGVDVPGAAEHAEMGDDDELHDCADRRHERAREDEQVVGGVQQQEPEMAPAVAEARQLRLAAAGVVLDIELA